MSESSSPVTAGIFRYVAERTVKDDTFLVELKLAAVEAGLPPISIAPEQAGFMQILLKLVKAREVVEVGTLAGYSAIWMARALPPGGRVRTIEVSGKHADFAQHWVERSDVADRIVIHRGAGKDILPKFGRDSADAVFLDADKPSYSRYLEESLRIVRRGGLVMADNAFAFGQLLEPGPVRGDVEAVRSFNEVIAAEKGLQSIIVPFGDGLWVGVKL